MGFFHDMTITPSGQAPAIVKGGQGQGLGDKSSVRRFAVQVNPAPVLAGLSPAALAWRGSWSVGAHAKDAHPVAHQGGLAELVKDLESAKACTEKDGPYLAPAIFNGTRSSSHAQAFTIIGLDFDDLPVDGLDLLREGLAGVLAIVHETTSSTPEQPKARAYLLLARTITPAEHAALYARVLAALAYLKPDAACGDLARLFYTCRRGRGCEILDGTPLDPAVLLASTPAPMANPGTATGTPAPLADQGPATIDPGLPLRLIAVALKRAPTEGRNEMGLWLACQLRDVRLVREEAEPHMGAYVAQSQQPTDKPPYTTNEALASLNQAYSAAPREPLPTHYDPHEIAQARRFVDGHRETILYDIERQTWRIWTGSHWALDTDNGQVLALAKETGQRTFDQTRARMTPDSKDGALGWARNCCRLSTCRNVTTLASADPRVRISDTDFDTDPMLFNVQNGTIDLRTGELRPHDRADILSMLSPVTYDPDAKSELWLRVIRHAANGDDALVKFLHRLVGYWLTGLTVDERIFYFLGRGATGKSVFSGSLRQMMGPYAVPLDFGALGEQRSQTGPKPELVKLRGARAVFSSEIVRGMRTNEGLIKSLTGGDPFSVRNLYEGSIEFIPVCKLVLAANDPPLSRTDDDAAWRRIRKITFDHVVPQGERDPTIKTRLLEPEHQSAILAWAVEGCLAWQQDGLQEPASVMADTEALRKSMHPLAAFLDSCCEVGAGLQQQASELLAQYQLFCRDTNTTPASNFDWANQLAQIGATRKHTRQGYVWVGIQLRPTQGER